MERISPGALTRLALGLALLSVATVASYAVDGVIEINEAKALAGGVTVGDGAGFPVLISESGSYRLTGNLTVPNEDTTAISITASDVTLDLNGFAIIGPVACAGTPPTCTPSGGIGVGIFHAGSRLTVINGVVKGMGSHGISSGFGDNRVENVHVVSNGEAGIKGGQGDIIRGNTVRLCGADGISAGFGSLVLENTLAFNAGFGIALSSPTAGFAGNILRGNNGGGGPQVDGGTQIGTNLCNANTTCP